MTVAETLAAMPTGELIDLIRRGLAADEETARNATPGTWKLWAMGVRSDVDSTGNLDTSLRVANTYHENGLRTWNAEHIARHGPTRVLDDVDSRRRILVRCEEELLSDIPRVVHFAQETLRDIARPYLTQETP